MMKELFFFDYYLRVSIIFFCYSAGKEKVKILIHPTDVLILVDVGYNN